MNREPSDSPATPPKRRCDTLAPARVSRLLELEAEVTPCAVVAQGSAARSETRYGK